LFLKVNLLSTSGMASVGLLHQEAVGLFVTESQFVQAVAFASVLPGSDALQLAMFIGYNAAGMPGALAALAGSILPPTLLMLGVAALLHRLRREAWVRSFVQGLTPAVAVLMVFVAWKLVRKTELNWQVLSLGAASLIAFLLEAPPPLVLLAAGLAGVFLLR
jgi:chromate transporter